MLQYKIVALLKRTIVLRYYLNMVSPCFYSKIAPSVFPLGKLGEMAVVIYETAKYCFPSGIGGWEIQKDRQIGRRDRQIEKEKRRGSRYIDRERKELDRQSLKHTYKKYVYTYAYVFHVYMTYSKSCPNHLENIVPMSQSKGNRLYVL